MPGLLAMILLLAIPAIDPFKPFDDYAGRREQEIWREIRTPEKFLWIDRLEGAARQLHYQQLRNGEILIDRGRRSSVPGGLIHHWTGVVFLPATDLARTLRLIQDYDHHAATFAPDLMASQLISRNGNRFHIRQRYLRKKILTVVLDTEHEISFVGIDPRHTASFGYTSSIHEVENPGSPHEKRLPYGRDKGFLWKMNSYWRFAEQDGGVYVQCETISLSRSIPMGLDLIVGRFIDSVPRESLQFTLRRISERAPGH